MSPHEMVPGRPGPFSRSIILSLLTSGLYANQSFMATVLCLSPAQPRRGPAQNPRGFLVGLPSAASPALAESERPVRTLLGAVCHLCHQHGIQLF